MVRDIWSWDSRVLDVFRLVRILLYYLSLVKFFLILSYCPPWCSSKVTLVRGHGLPLLPSFFFYGQFLSYSLAKSELFPLSLPFPTSSAIKRLANHLSFKTAKSVILLGIEFFKRTPHFTRSRLFPSPASSLSSRHLGKSDFGWFWTPFPTSFFYLTSPDTSLKSPQAPCSFLSPSLFFFSGAFVFSSKGETAIVFRMSLIRFFFALPLWLLLTPRVAQFSTPCWPKRPFLSSNY